MVIMEIKPAFPLFPAEFRILNKTVVENMHSDSGQLKAELGIFGLSGVLLLSERSCLIWWKSVDVIGYVL